MRRSIQIRFLFRAMVCAASMFAASLAIANEDLDKLEQAGKQIAAALNDRREDRILELIDLPAYAARVAAIVSEQERDRAEFARHFLNASHPKTYAALLVAGMDQMDNARAKYMKLVRRGDEHRPLLRLDAGESGFEYVEFILQADESDALRIVDWEYLSNGEPLSRSAGAMTRLLIDPTPHLFKALFGMEEVDHSAIQRIHHIAGLRKRGRHLAVYEEMGELPSQILDLRVMLVLRATMAQMADEEEKYHAELERLANLHGDDPAAAFLLIDHYFYRGDLARTLQAIDTIEKRVGRDAMMESLRSQVHKAFGNPTRAVHHAREAIELEPDFESAYFALAELYIETSQFNEAVGMYSALETNFGYEFSAEKFGGDTDRAFKASPSFERWIQR